MEEQEKKEEEAKNKMTEAGIENHRGMIERTKLNIVLLGNQIDSLHLGLKQDIPNRMQRATILENQAKKKQEENNLKALEKQLKKALRS